jgi:uroporphyrinogen decarboxylase
MRYLLHYLIEQEQKQEKKMTKRIFNAPVLKATPDFSNILDVLKRKVPSRPTLFEFFMNTELYSELTGHKVVWDDSFSYLQDLAVSFTKAGYDYTTWKCPGADFAIGDDDLGGFHASGGTMINSREDFEKYPWPDAEQCRFDMLEKIKPELPDGMKIIIYGPGGVLENAIQLIGFENLCYMIIDDEELAEDIFNKIGSILTRYYEIVADIDIVGACIVNDDWGFKTQPMLPPENMQRFVVSNHKKIVEKIHSSGKPAILHSCGNQTVMYDTIIDYLEYDGKHSYEDAIQPVEDAYEQYGDRIAILGGIDLDFVCRSEPEEVYKRAKAMLERASERGGYALGTGNSVPEYVPPQNYYAMITAALEYRK